MPIIDHPIFKYPFPRLRDVPLAHRFAFEIWLNNKVGLGTTSRPQINGVHDDQQDFFLPSDYTLWQGVYGEFDATPSDY